MTALIADLVLVVLFGAALVGGWVRPWDEKPGDLRAALARSANRER